MDILRRHWYKKFYFIHKKKKFFFNFYALLQYIRAFHIQFFVLFLYIWDMQIIL